MTTHNILEFILWENEAPNIICIIHKMVLTQFESNIKVIWSNNGQDHLQRQLKTYFKEHGNTHQNGCANTQKQNGVAE